MSITIQIDTDVEARLRVEAAEQGMSLEQWISRYVEKRFRRPGWAPETISKQEAKLLEEINLNVSPELWARYHELKAKRKSLLITDRELVEYQQINEQIELENARRLKSLAELAKLRGVALLQLMRDLGLQHRGNE